MDLGNFLDQKHINQEVGDNIYSPVEMDIVEQTPQQKQEEVYTFTDWRQRIGNLLMQGYHKKQILAMFKTNIKIANNLEEVVSYLDWNDGILGTIVIDCGLRHDTKYSSKMKKFNKYAINCECGSYKQSFVRKNSSDGSIDGLLNEEAKMIKSKVSYCKKSGLPVIKSFSGMKLSKLQEVVDTLVSDGYISSKRGDIIKSSKNILSELQDVFVNKVGIYDVNKNNLKLDKTAQQYKLVESEFEADSINVSSSLDMNYLKQNDEQFRNVGLSDNDYNLTVDVQNQVFQDDIMFDNAKEQISFDELDYGQMEQVGDTVVQDLQIDNEQYIDDEWYQKDQINFEQEQFDKTKKDLTISDNYSFDF